MMTRFDDWLERHKHLQGTHNQKAHGRRGGAKVSQASQSTSSGLPELTAKEQARLEYYRKADSDPLTNTAWEYRLNPSSSGLESIERMIKVDPVFAHLANDENRKLKFDADETITLYRGGNDKGMSWTIHKSEAERFGRFQFGSVSASASGQIGMQAIRSGSAKKKPQVFERKFNRDDILYSMATSGEGEVLVKSDSI